MLGNNTEPSGNIGKTVTEVTSRLRSEVRDVDRLRILHEDRRELFLEVHVVDGDLLRGGDVDEKGEADLRALRRLQIARERGRLVERPGLRPQPAGDRRAEEPFVERARLAGDRQRDRERR